MASTPRRHRVTITCEGQEIAGWISYEVSCSMLEASDAFSMTRPWSQDAWNVLRRDARVRVFIDGVQVLDGFIDDRGKTSDHDGTKLSISGRDRAGRLVQESAPAIDYNGLEMTEAIRRLADPWFTKVSLSDARNRSVRRGKGFKVPIGNEPIIIRKIAQRGAAHPGQSRWSIIEEIVSEAGLVCWSSADGTELFVGKPISAMAPQYAIRNCKPGSANPSTCKRLNYTESNGDRFSLIATVGSGGGTTQDFGESVSSRRAFVVDNEANTFDGTGRDFIYPKRLLMPERSFNSMIEASTVAGREQARRDFHRTKVTATMPFHGQWIGAGAPTIFAFNTIASVYDEDWDPPMDDDFLIHAVTFNADRDSGESSTLELVPDGTEVIL